MSEARIDVDRLVREVLARLHESAGQEERPDGSCERCAQESVGRTLRIEDKVISQRSLEGRLSNIEAIEVPPGGVITPAARDYLREHETAIRSAKSCDCEAGSAGALLVAVVGTRTRMEPLSSAIESLGIAVRRIDGDDMIQVVDKIIDAIVCEPLAAVLCTDQPEVAACLANRHPKVRAAQVTDAASLHRATEELGANLLIVDPLQRSIPSLARLIERFAAAPPKRCRPQYEARLG